MQKISDELHNLSLCEVADLIKTKQVSAVETCKRVSNKLTRLIPFTTPSYGKIATVQWPVHFG
jgi:hypothetical protein